VAEQLRGSLLGPFTPVDRRRFFLGEDNVTDSGRYVFPSSWRSTDLPLGGRFGQMSSLIEYYIENRRDSLGSIEVKVYIDGAETASFTDTIDGTGDGWRTDFESFKGGMIGERFSIEMTGIGLDTMDVSGVLIIHSPMGTIK